MIKIHKTFCEQIISLSSFAPLIAINAESITPKKTSVKIDKQQRFFHSFQSVYNKYLNLTGIKDKAFTTPSILFNWNDKYQLLDYAPMTIRTKIRFLNYQSHLSRLLRCRKVFFN